MLNYDVVLCTFNGEPFVEEQLNSILGQTLPPAHLIVRDDGSSDRTVSIVRKVLDGQRISSDVVVRQEASPIGPAQNFSNALDDATAEWVALADQDDVWREDKMVLLAERAANSASALLLASNARLIDSSGGALGRTLFSELRVSRRELEALNDERQFKTALRRNVLAGNTFLVHRRLLDLALPVPVGWMHDHWLVVVAAAHDGLAVLDDPLVDYRQHEGNVIGSGHRSVRNRISRVLRGSLDADAALSMFSKLPTHLSAKGPVSHSAIEMANAKRDFEARRSLLPEFRIARALPVARMVLDGSYRRFASNRELNAFRDIVQPRVPSSFGWPT